MVTLGKVRCGNCGRSFLATQSSKAENTMPKEFDADDPPAELQAKPNGWRHKTDKRFERLLAESRRLARDNATHKVYWRILISVGLAMLAGIVAACVELVTR